MASSTEIVNVAARLAATARSNPDGLAVVMPQGRDKSGKRQYATITFRELEADTNRIAAGLRRIGIRPGTKIVLLVKPSIDFVALVFALFKVGAISVLID